MYTDIIEIIDDTMKIIDSHINKDFSRIKILIEGGTNYTYSYISELFKCEFGLTTHEYILYLQNEIKNKGKKIINDNPIKRHLQERILFTELVDKSKLIKKYKVDGENATLHINNINWMKAMTCIPIIILPSVKLINDSLKQIHDLKDKILQMYILSVGFLTQEKELTIEIDEFEYVSNLAKCYNIYNATIYNGLQIYTVFNKCKLTMSRDTKKILKDQDVFSRIATICNLKACDFSNLIESNELRSTLIGIVTEQSFNKTFQTMDELVHFVYKSYYYDVSEIFEEFIKLVNDGIIFYLSEPQSKYFEM